MQCTITNHKLGTITFSRPGMAYIFVDVNGHAGSFGLQLCRDGRFTGRPLEYIGLDETAFEAVCRAWLHDRAKVGA